MITESLTIGTILVSCGLLTWYAMKKYHPKIEQRLEEIEVHSTEMEITEKKSKNKN